MTEYLIFHHKNPIFFLPESQNGAYPVMESEFNKIAIVEAADLSELFTKTNHIDHDWTTNEGVNLFPDITQVRSTSVGDLVLNMDTMELLICAPIGWEKAEWVG